MTETECALIAKLAYACWPHVELTPELIAAFSLALGCERADDARQALKNCLRDKDRTFPPTPPEILAEIVYIKRERAALKASEREQKYRASLPPSNPQTDADIARNIAKAKAQHPELFTDD